ncbi:hypothetical protein PPERSA_11049 [Pseudocohnilembus persalinus]|uniref:Uncharacterized protein n=1 Tax=Pseudocohnilembus persalinus TaxID=266149 RepID=A0A0V0QYW1_PSEPJ|nr:hypothetical protein PPERSA_11049 [Pseudocohnilembus persalinus]|eukprot:KRX07500.1 hypothetical protein PPERSA_11049 [Pseudocohnilembus persalinus]
MWVNIRKIQCPIFFSDIISESESASKIISVTTLFISDSVPEWLRDCIKQDNQIKHLQCPYGLGGSNPPLVPEWLRDCIKQEYQIKHLQCPYGLGGSNPSLVPEWLRDCIIKLNYIKHLQCPYGLGGSNPPLGV